MSTGLDEVLSGTNPEPVAPEAVVAPVVEAAPEPEKAPEPIVEVEKPKEPPKQDLGERERAFLRAAEEERRKRQQAEQRIKELEQAQPKQQFWDDPEKALQSFNEQIQKQVQQVAVSTRMQTAEMIARNKYQDFDAKVDVFANLMQTVPGLTQQWLASPDPAEFAYRAAKNHLDLQEAGNLDALREKIAKEERLKLEKEFQEKEAKRAQERAGIPPTLSSAPGQPGQNKPVWGGPTPLGDIIGR